MRLLMQSMMLRNMSVGLAVVLAAACSSAAGDDTSSSSGSDWQLRGGNAEGQHFSSLQQINEDSVGRLGLAWHSDLPMPDAPVGTPLIKDGLLYLVGTLNIVYAHDVRTGRLRWTYDPKIRFAGKLLPSWGARVARGLAYSDGKILLTTSDCRLLAITAATGELAWQSRVCPKDDEYTITSAPRVGGGKVFVGPNNADFGTRRGYVDAFDVRNGKHLWRFWTIPGDPSDAGKPEMAMAAKTWDPTFLKDAVGGSVWEEMIHDPISNLLYIGVGGPTPWIPDDRGAKRGDELFTNSIVALNADTGAYVWHYQTTPDDAWNLEPTMPMVLADLTIDGARRRVLMQAPKNGFFYVLDARTGKLVNQPSNFVRVNWTKGLDPKTGRPIPHPDAEYWRKPEGAVVYPGPLGAHNFNPMSFNPESGLVYIPAMHLPTKMSVDRRALAVGGAVQVDFLSHADKARWPLVAWDPVRQKAKWTTDGSFGAGSGVLSTAGKIVFQGTSDGVLRAYRATDGKLLWSYDVGSTMVAAPVTVTVDDQQMLFVVAGAGTTSAVGRNLRRLFGGVQGAPRLLAFRLDGKAALPARVVTASPFPKPSRARPSAQLANQGRILFETRACFLCHGVDADVGPGSVPDLRRSSALVHDGFEGIVRGGAYQEKGMPMFFDMVTPEESAALQAFVLQEAWNAYEAQSQRRSATAAPAPSE